MKTRVGRGGRIVGVLAVAALALSASLVDAQVLIDSQGYESPPFSTGVLEGQNNWVFAPSLPPNESTADVQTLVVASGNQAVEVNRSANTNDRWFVFTPVTPDAGRPYIDVSWDMRVEDAQSPTGAFGPYFAVEAGDFFGPVQGLLGSLGVDATTGDVLYQAQDTGFLTEAGRRVAFGEWNSFGMRLDFLNNQYLVFLNGELLQTTGFVDRASGVENFSDATLSALAASGDAISQALPGTAYFDNYKVVQRPFLSGDFNGNGAVGGDDLLWWQRGDTADPFSPLELAVWEANYGLTTGAPASVAGGVPEPASVALLAVVGMGASIYLRQRRRSRANPTCVY